MTVLTVVAHLSTPIIGVDRCALMLDAPLSWAWMSRAKGRGERIPPITQTYAPDFPLPLARCDEYDPWIWCSSAGVLDVAAWTGVQVRRKPAVQEMARFSPDRRHHVGLGPYKARDTTLAAVLARSITWEIDCIDQADMEDLLGHVTNLGGRHRNNFGRVERWDISTSRAIEGWRARPMPPDEAARAPYWHPSRRAHGTHR